jgi:hypothetical protein
MNEATIVSLAVIVAIIGLLTWWRERTIKKYREQLANGERTPQSEGQRLTRRIIGSLILVAVTATIVVHFVLTYGR